MLRLSLALLLPVLLLFGSGLIYSQYAIEFSPEAEQAFAKAVELYNERQFAESASRFEGIIKMPATNQRTTAAYVMRAKALMRINEPLEAARTLRNFLSLHTSSSYVPDAEYTMGLVYLKIQRYDDAVQSFLTAWRSGGTVEHLAFEALDRTLGAYFDADAISSLLSQARTEHERAFYWLKIGEKDAAQGRTTNVGVVLDTLYRNYPTTQFNSRIAALRTMLEQSSNVKLGVLLPLLTKSDPSAVKEIGNDINDGIQFAVDEYAKDPERRVTVTLETRDTERDVLVAIRGIQELTSNNDIIGILGPVFSNEVSAVVPLANRRGYPLISPTANANGIAAAGQYIFQANPDYETRGRAMARYAIEKMGCKVLAVLAPTNSFGKFMAESFMGEALHLGARVIVSEWYERGAADLKSQMASIRRAGLKAGADPMIAFGKKMSREDIVHLVEFGLPMKTIDSLMHNSAVVSATTLLGPNAKQMIDSAGIAAFYEDRTVDSLEYPVTAIDGIYVPIGSSEEIGIISSQLMYYNIKARMLGSGEWNNLVDLIANKRYCNDVIFESDSYVDPSDTSYATFVNKYIDRYRKKPSKNALYGYDTAMLALNAIHHGATSREALMNSLKNVREYHGKHSRISFSQKRVNSWLWVLQFTGDQIQQIDGSNVE